MANMVDYKNLNQRVLINEDQYTKYKTLKVFCGTFNVNGKNPDESLTPWLNVNGLQPDIYAIGFQEVVDLTTTSYLLKSEWAEKEQYWTNYVADELLRIRGGFLSTVPRYRFLAKIKMFGLFLLIYASDRIKPEAISDVLTSSVSTGVLTLGNKGSVAVSLKVHETRLCFVCSHLAADTDKLEKRNADYRSTRQYLRFQQQQQSAVSAVSDNNSNSSYIDLDQHDIIFWFGDLNYRIDKVSLLDTLQMISANAFDQLAQYDQLSNERANGRVFEHYTEGKLNFQPTYKYLIKSDIYEKQALAQQQLQQQITTNATADAAESTSGGDQSEQLATTTSTTTSTTISNNNSNNVKVKLPSWTDRVLWKSTNLSVKLLRYECVNVITISDHKPVYALFEAQVKKIDQKQLDKLVQALIKESDRKTNEEMPHISLEAFEFNFGECLYYDTRTLHMVVRNASCTRTNVDVIFYDSQTSSASSMNNNNSSSSSSSNHKCEPDEEQLMVSVHRYVSRAHQAAQWLNIFPQHKERVEANSSYRIDLTTSFHQRLLARLNREPRVDDFLIVRCLNGNDSFATVSCTYRPTIIGISLKALGTLPRDQSFAACDQTQLVSSVEASIADFELQLSHTLVDRLKTETFEAQRDTVERLLGKDIDFMSLAGSPTSTSSTSTTSASSATVAAAAAASAAASERSVKAKSVHAADQPTAATTAHSIEHVPSVARAKIDIYQRTLRLLRDQIVGGDPLFHNELSAEYAFLMRHLIERAIKNLRGSLSSEQATDSVRTGDETTTTTTTTTTVECRNNQSAGELTDEEQKNMILVYLSSRNFADMERHNFDLELLGEVLNDLLKALPHPLIPVRYLDYCSYTEGAYEDARQLFAFVPRAHVQLFELIVKFLQIYLKCLTSCDTNYHNILADSIFQSERSSSPPNGSGANANVRNSNSGGSGGSGGSGSKKTTAAGLLQQQYRLSLDGRRVSSADTSSAWTQPASKFLKLFIEKHDTFLFI